MYLNVGLFSCNNGLTFIASGDLCTSGNVILANIMITCQSTC